MMRWSVRFYACFCFNALLNFPILSGRRILSASEYGEFPAFNRQLLEATNISYSQKQITTPESHRVTSLPGLKESEKIVHFAGHINVDEQAEGNIFYWLIEAQTVDPATAPVLVWLNGGPGCSSMDGLFIELGPFRLDGPNMDQIKINPGSWHYAANLLFVDQPVGTGLSYTLKNRYDGTDEAINNHFYKFLTKFFKLHDRFTSIINGTRISREFHMSGESHAGHYIPSMAAYILKKNKEILGTKKDDSITIDLKGVALGNPWTDPYNQYDVSEFAHGMGLITQGQKNKLKEMNKQCRNMLKQGKYNQKACFALLDDVVDSSSLGGSHKVLMYDARRFVHATSVFPPGHEHLERYLNKVEVKRAIHALSTPHSYVECADPPFLALSHQDGKGVTAELTEILNNGLKVLLYSGQFDIICNHMGSEKMLMELPWSGRSDWLKAQPGVWLVDKQPAGYIKTYKNLQSLLVLNSGHMVPLDVPKIALDMISRFLSGKDFSSGASTLGVSLVNPECENSENKRSSYFVKRVAGHSSNLDSGESDRTGEKHSSQFVLTMFSYENIYMSSLVIFPVLIAVVIFLRFRRSYKQSLSRR